MESKYTEPWSRQRPKGYESTMEPVMNNGLAMKIFSEFCCDSCSCKSESDHTDNK